MGEVDVESPKFDLSYPGLWKEKKGGDGQERQRKRYVQKE